ncbi:MAG: hypothetical protein ACT6RU_18665, partial [Aliihoeflea sp.]|uniref:hypothetical protein n=1 Tax=Aliihoeflea sp. TaxID=2608088 RepID=UPI004033B7EF
MAWLVFVFGKRPLCDGIDVSSQGYAGCIGGRFAWQANPDILSEVVVASATRLWQNGRMMAVVVE